MTENNSFSGIAKKAAAELPGFVTEKRLRHIYSVLDTAEFLCDFFCSLGAEISKDDVICAALLHDVTKCMEQQTLCRELGISLSQEDERSPETLHAVTGAYFARKRYGISDSVFSAIAKHTVGGCDMSLFDKIIFVSDYCEETRRHEECRLSRARLLEIPIAVSMLLPEERLNAATRLFDLVFADILGKTVKYLSEKGDFVNPQTVLTFKTVIQPYICKQPPDSDFVLLANGYRECIEF